MFKRIIFVYFLLTAEQPLWYDPKSSLSGALQERLKLNAAYCFIRS